MVSFAVRLPRLLVDLDEFFPEWSERDFFLKSVMRELATVAQFLDLWTH